MNQINLEQLAMHIADQFMSTSEKNMASMDVRSFAEKYMSVFKQALSCVNYYSVMADTKNEGPLANGPEENRIASKFK